MPKINYLIRNHKLPKVMEPIARSYMPKIYDLDAWRVGQIERAMGWIQENVVNHKRTSKTCDKSFEKLPAGQTFTDLWNNSDIWISFHTDPSPTLYGEAVLKGHDIAIAYGSFRKGWEAVAATLIHELAHINGAPGDTKQAEKTLKRCGLSEQYDSTIIGFLETMPANAVRFV